MTCTLLHTSPEFCHRPDPIVLSPCSLTSVVSDFPLACRANKMERISLPQSTASHPLVNQSAVEQPPC